MTSQAIKKALGHVKTTLENALDGRPLALVFVANIVTIDSRVLKTGKSLEKSGYQTVLFGVHAKGYSISSVDGMTLVLVPSPLECLKDAGASGWVEWSNEIGKRVANISRDYVWDVIYTHDMFSFPVGYDLVLPQRSRGEEVYWVHDIHEDVQGYDGVLHPAKIDAAVTIERKYFWSPDLILTVNENLRDALAARYNYDRRIHVVYNCPVVNADKLVKPLREKIVLPENALLGVYLGRATPLRGMDMVVPLLKRRSDIHFAIVSDVQKSTLEQVRRSADKEGVGDRLHILPYVPHDEVTSFVRGCDFGLSLLARYGNTENAVPTKIMEYLLADVPVVASPNEMQKEFVLTHNIGAVTEDSEDVEALSAAVDIAVTSFAPTPALKEHYVWNNQIQPVLDDIGEKKFLAYKNELSGPRIFQGPSNGAGQPGALARALRDLGVNASAVSVAPPNTYGYVADFVWHAPTHQSMAALAHKCLSYFDIFHYHARPILKKIVNGQFSTPSLADMVAAKAAGKTVLFSFRGGEARCHDDFMRHSPFAWKEEEDYGQFLTNEQKRLFVRAVCEIADLVTVTDPELAEYVPGARILPRSIDCGAWPYIGPVNHARPLVVHAPSRRGVKGTSHVLEAVEALQQEGLEFDFELIENMSHTEARERYEASDIIIDQLRIGWYGNLAVEGMALGKTVVAYVREDLTDFFDGTVPLVNGNPQTIKDVLRRCISDAALRERIGRSARRFGEAYHDHRRVAELLLGFYGEARQNTAFDSRTFINLQVNSSIRSIAFEKKAEKYAALLKEQNNKSSPNPAAKDSVPKLVTKKAIPKKVLASKKPYRKGLFDPPYSKIIPRALRRMGLRK